MLRIGSHDVARLWIGTGGLTSLTTLAEVVHAASPGLVTVSLRRTSDLGPSGLHALLAELGVPLLPNTAGCHSAREAVLTAQLAREALGTSLVKLEVIGDDVSLLPDVVGLLSAAQELVADGFTVLPYTTADPVVASRLADVGCAAVMPLGSPHRFGPGHQRPRGDRKGPRSRDGAGDPGCRDRQRLRRGPRDGARLRRRPRRHGDHPGCGPGRDGAGPAPRGRRRRAGGRGRPDPPAVGGPGVLADVRDGCPVRPLPRLLVVVPRGGRRRLDAGPGVLVVAEEDLVKCHDVAEVRAAVGAPVPAEFVTISPVAPTASKPGYGPALGVAGVRAAVAAAHGVPVFALGGVTPANAPSFLAAGAHGVAVMGPVLRADEPQAVVATYLAVLEEAAR